MEMNSKLDIPPEPTSNAFDAPERVMSERILSQIWIDRDSALPMYQQLEEQLEMLITSGTWDAKEPLPSETLLAERLQISVMTVRQAMGRLVNKGLIYRAKGRGTFIMPQPMECQLQQLASFSEDMRARDLSTASQTLVFKTVVAPSIVAVRLNLEPGTTVLRIKRLRLVRDRPVALHDAYVPWVDLDRNALENLGSLYVLLEQKGVELMEAEETLEATVADEEVARLLDASPGAPLLKITRLTLGRNRTPVELLIALYRADFCRYAVTRRKM
jgi:GntR family transcriptional regulator